jgi:hypothetical protein
VNAEFEATGGARVGWVNATWPFAKLTASPHALSLEIGLVGDYTFRPDQVVALSAYTMIPLLGWGIRIEHRVAHYPARVIFWSFGRPDSLLTRIREAGFQPQAQTSTIPQRTGMAFRWQAVAIALLVWNGLFLLDMYSGGPPPAIPGPLALLALGLTCAACLATQLWPDFQDLVLKPGRNVGEIRPFLNLLLLVTGLMAFTLTIFNVLR